MFVVRQKYRLCKIVNFDLCFYVKLYHCKKLYIYNRLIFFHFDSMNIKKCSFDIFTSQNQKKKTPSLTCYLTESRYLLTIFRKYPHSNIHLFLLQGEHSGPKCYMCDGVIEPDNCRTIGYCEMDEVIFIL